MLPFTQWIRRYWWDRESDRGRRGRKRCIWHDSMSYISRNDSNRRDPVAALDDKRWMCREPASEDSHVPKVGTRCESLSPICSGLFNFQLQCTSENAIHLGLVFTYKEGSIPCSFNAVTSLTLVLIKLSDPCLLPIYLPRISSHYISNLTLWVVNLKNVRIKRLNQSLLLRLLVIHPTLWILSLR